MAFSSGGDDEGPVVNLRADVRQRLCRRLDRDSFLLALPQRQFNLPVDFDSREAGKAASFTLRLRGAQRSRRSDGDCHCQHGDYEGSQHEAAVR